MSYNPYAQPQGYSGSPPRGAPYGHDQRSGGPPGHRSPPSYHRDAPPSRGGPGYGGDRFNDDRRGRPGDARDRDEGWGSMRRGPRRRSASPGYDRGAPGGGGGGGMYGRDEPYGHDQDRYRGGPGGGRGRGMDRGGSERMNMGDPFRRRFDDEQPRNEQAVISERVKLERPGRTLFVRNLKFGVTSEEVRQKFAAIGDIKTFFDLVEKRAMAFVTYYDARAAMMAKDRLHNSMLQGRPMDIHYSLPRDADLAKDCDREKGQGTLSLVILPFVGARINQALPPPPDSELYSRFSAFGDIKSVFPSFKRPDMRYIEYFDSRGTAMAYDRVHQTPMAGGIADLRFVWDKAPPPESQPPPQAAPSAAYGAPPSGPPMGFGGPPPPGPGYGAPPPPSGYGAPPPGPYGAYGAPPPGPAPYGGPPAPFGSNGPPPPPSMGYPGGVPPPLVGGAGAAPGGPPPPGAAHGVEQAKRMQELLANLMSNPSALQGVLPPGAPNAPTGAPAAPPHVNDGRSPIGPPPSQPGGSQFYQPSPYSQARPPPPHTQPPLGLSPVPASSNAGYAAPAPAPPPPGNSTPLPAAVSTLLAQATGAAPPPPSHPTTSMQSQISASATSPALAPPTENNAASGTPNQVQALLALLASQKGQSA
ncbi:hypothetical protein JCM10212_003067 [Sporobolomyces blumeae]